ncbi:MAG: histidine kinase dimerization/phospho-acceptor domain-containing protein, partial [Bdellovibrio sp.]
MSHLLRYGRSINDLLILSLALFYQFISRQIISFEVLKVLYLMVAVSLTWHFFSAAFFNRIRSRPWLIFVMSFLDLVWISALQVQVQLPVSVPLLMGVVVIVLTGLSLGQRSALGIASLASLGSAIAFGFSPEVPTISSLFLVFLQMLTFAGVAALSGLLSDQLEAQGFSLDLQKKLNAMILQTLPSGLLSLQWDGVILRANFKAQQLLGASDLEGRRVEEYFSGQEIPWQDLLKSDQSFRKEFFWKPDRLLDLRVFPQGDGSNRTHVVIFDDLTEVRRLEGISRQNEKMAAVGQLAAGIAHEIRNPLASISVSLQLMDPRQETEEDQKLRQIALREVDRLNRLISEFLDFAKPNSIESKPFSLSRLLKDLKQMLERDARFESIRMNLMMENSNEFWIRGSEEKIRQVFLNLAINAVEAMGPKPGAQIDFRVQDPDGFI